MPKGGWRRLVIAGGRVVDPARGLDGVADLVLEEGLVREVGRGLAPPRPDGATPAEAGGAAAQGRGPAAGAAAGTAAGTAGGRFRWEGDAAVLDAAGLVVAPGFVDLHAHLRTPGQEWKEDMESGTRAAAAGGFTTVCCMANTRPPVDSGAMVLAVQDLARRRAVVRVRPLACVTRGLAGERLTDVAELAEAGAVALSDDGRPVADAALMRNALTYAAAFGLPVSVHEEEPSLARGTAAHLGPAAAALGLRGQPGEAEAVLAARDVLLAAATGGRLHVAHVSAAATVAVLRWARARGIPVTAEVTPHHLALTEEALAGHDTDAKCNPPLRGEEDRLALVEALAEGVIDCIATDHAPHAPHEKAVEFDAAPFGVVGFETALGVLVTTLVRPGRLTLAQLVERLSTRPAAVFGLPAGSLAPGAAGDVVVFDPEAEWTVDPERFFTKGRNTPFRGRRLRGRVVATFVGGVPVYLAPEAAPAGTWVGGAAGGDGWGSVGVAAPAAPAAPGWRGGGGAPVDPARGGDAGAAGRVRTAGGGGFA